MIMPVKDEEKIICDVIESIINQTVKPVLWLIIDDGSTDSSPKIIQPQQYCLHSLTSYTRSKLLYDICLNASINTTRTATYTDPFH